MNAETIYVTPIKNNLALINADAVRRLKQLGFKRRSNAIVGRAAHSQSQMEYLKAYGGIRDLDHYRELVGDPRSQGPLVRIEIGRTILMERVAHPFNANKAWYVLMDTALGCSEIFINEMVRIKHLKVKAVANTDVPALSNAS